MKYGDWWNMMYGGWRIYQDYRRGGVYTAERFGVTMCHKDKARLLDMVAERVKEREAGRSYV